MSVVNLWKSLPTLWVEIAPYFGRAENSNVFGKKLSEMLKFPARESWLFHVDRFCPYKARNDKK